jgi:serine/threonine protein kinase
VIGYCEEGDQQISIYEYMPGGTLLHLHDKGFLDWKTRLQIALHIAQGLQYFGTQHPRLWGHTIFLTKNWVPKSILIPSQNTEGPWLRMLRFGYFLWELISRQPTPYPGQGLNDLVLFLEFIVHFLFTH